MQRTMVGFCFMLLIGLDSCLEKRTQDPEKVYRYWSGGEDPPMDVHVVEGQYWESAHWSKEFELYLEVYAPKSWREALIRENDLEPAKEKRDPPADAPGWFRPDGKMELLIERPGNAARVEFYVDTASGHLLMHALQL